jgi:hypothetical protein
MMRHYANSDGSMYPNQGRTLAPKFGVSRRTIMRMLAVLVREGVFTVERRCRGVGGGRGRTTNVYRFNPACVTQIGTQVVTLVGTLGVTAEVPSVHVEATQVELPTGENEPSEDEAPAVQRGSDAGSSSSGSHPTTPSLTPGYPAKPVTNGVNRFGEPTYYGMIREEEIAARAVWHNAPIDVATALQDAFEQGRRDRVSLDPIFSPVELAEVA